MILLFTLTSGALFSQVSISEESEITAIMTKYKNENSRVSFVRAWRIQVLTTNDRLEMETGIKEFQSLYPDMKFEWEHNPPYYQVKAGAYELRPDLDKVLMDIKQHFPAAMPIQAEMSKTKLLK